MLQPVEMTLDLPMEIANQSIATTQLVWEILVANYRGDLQFVQQLAESTPDLLYAQYNYTPPIHFAVREGHTALVQFLLDRGALDPTYKTYPFLESLVTIARERGYEKIAVLLEEYIANPSRQQFRGDSGQIFYKRTEEVIAFEKAVDEGKYDRVKEMLGTNAGLVNDPTFFWSEGILMMPAKDNNRMMVEILLNAGASVPLVTKWGRFYYFKHFEIARFLMENGMDANHRSWHNVTLLHDMAQDGTLDKAQLLLDHGAELNVLDEEFQSTPLGFAARWGNEAMVRLLLDHGADRKLAGAEWSTPLNWAKKRGHTSIIQLLQ